MLAATQTQAAVAKKETVKLYQEDGQMGLTEEVQYVTAEKFLFENEHGGGQGQAAFAYNGVEFLGSG